jgi:hypothetical protein
MVDLTLGGSRDGGEEVRRDLTQEGDGRPESGIMTVFRVQSSVSWEPIPDKAL